MYLLRKIFQIFFKILPKLIQIPIPGFDIDLVSKCQQTIDMFFWNSFNGYILNLTTVFPHIVPSLE